MAKKQVARIDELERRIAALEAHTHVLSPSLFRTGGPNYPKPPASADSPQVPTP